MAEELPEQPELERLRKAVREIELYFVSLISTAEEAIVRCRHQCGGGEEADNAPAVIMWEALRDDRKAVLQYLRLTCLPVPAPAATPEPKNA